MHPLYLFDSKTNTNGISETTRKGAPSRPGLEASKYGYVWNLKAESVSKHSVAFLDIEPYKFFCYGEGRLLVKPFSKASKIRIPLMADSAHPPSSQSWPIAEVSRFRQLSSKSSDFKACVGSLILDLCEYGASVHTICSVLNQAKHCVSNSSCNSTPNRVIACILPYHPAWGPLFHQIARNVVDDFQQVLKFMHFPVRVKICWRNFYPCLHRSLKCSQIL
jgi:hypothetical protein